MTGLTNGTAYSFTVTATNTVGTSIASSPSAQITPAMPPFVQQGAKLIGSDMVGLTSQGISVALSADGNTAIVGGNSDNSDAGAAWVWTRSGGVWTQQGSKLVGSGAVGAAGQGSAVAISADGNTAIVGGYFDNNYTGAVWVWTRSGGAWTQQGNKLVGSGPDGNARQGHSVSLSSDGNTAIVGGRDDGYTGAVWVWTRSGGVWTQQGNKLVGSGVTSGNAGQGSAVALSADGNIAIVGGAYDSGDAGAMWVWTRSGGAWTQQGGKLISTGVIGIFELYLGTSVSLSANGNTAAIGGRGDNSNAGAIWVWTRSGGAWTQEAKLVGTGAIDPAQQSVVSLSSDGNTLIIGGPFDNTGVGAAWIFSRN